MNAQGSIQRWITVAALLAVALSVGAAGLFAARTLRARIISEAESSLESVLRLGATRMCAEARKIKVENQEFFSERDVGAMDGVLWLVEGSSAALRPNPRLNHGAGFEVLARTEGFPFSDFLAAQELSPQPGSADVRFVIKKGPDGEPYRLAMLALTPADARPLGPPDDRGPLGLPRPPRGDERGRPGGDRGGRGRPAGAGPRFEPDEHFQVYLAKSIRAEEAILDSLLGTLLLAGAVAVGLSALIVPWTVRRGLRPVRAISRKISDVDETRLDRPLEIDELPVELAPIVQSFEGVREHLSAAFAREGRFTSNAAHELRTPLAGLRASMEVALRRERTSDHYRATLDECLGITRSMQGMVDSLLLLAKGAGSGQERESVDLKDVLARAFSTHGGDLGRRGLTVRWSDVRDSLVMCNASLAERVFGNIVANAVQYAAPESVIAVRFEESPTRLCVHVENRCEGLTSDTAERAFEPLWRGDTVRTDASLHAGLGLSIVQQCLEAVGGSASVQVDGDRFAILASLPR